MKHKKILRKINQEENENVGNDIIYGEAKLEGNEVKVNGESLEYEKLLIANRTTSFVFLYF